MLSLSYKFQLKFGSEFIIDKRQQRNRRQRVKRNTVMHESVTTVTDSFVCNTVCVKRSCLPQKDDYFTFHKMSTE